MPEIILWPFREASYLWAPAPGHGDGWERRASGRDSNGSHCQVRDTDNPSHPNSAGPMARPTKVISHHATSYSHAQQEPKLRQNWESQCEATLPERLGCGVPSTGS